MFCHNIPNSIFPTRIRKKRAYCPTENDAIIVDRIFASALNVFGISRAAFMKKTRKPQISRPRMAVSHLIRCETLLGTKQVSALLNSDDHTFCIYCSKMVKNAIGGYDPPLLEMWDMLSEEYDRLCNG